jgi:hypothetical protein
MAAIRTCAAITVMAIAVPLLAAGPAFSECAENLTRIALALPSASPDIRAAAGDLLATAPLNEMKTKYLGAPAS